MNVTIFTIRNKHTKELIYAEGTQVYGEYCSDFRLEDKWLSDSEKDNKKNASWRRYYNGYGFNEEVRHLTNYEYDFVVFALEEVEVK